MNCSGFEGTISLTYLQNIELAVSWECENIHGDVHVLAQDSNRTAHLKKDTETKERAWMSG